MISPSTSVRPSPDEGDRIQRIFAAQQQAFLNHPYPTAEQRRCKIEQIKEQIQRFQDVLAQAISQDFGFRSPTESKMIEMLASIFEAKHAASHVRRWMRNSRRTPELLFATNSLRVTYQPKGVVGVIVPWNYPVYLAIGPLIAALAAGNRVMIKMPEATANTNTALRRMLKEVFPEDEVAVVGGELSDPNLFTSLPFDHIVFTGSPAVGRVVMRTAAENLTPVTLELGGKSPAIVLPDYPIAEAAKRITHGKATNCGQTCVSPDYALVPRSSVDSFVNEAVTTFRNLFGSSVENNPDYTSIVNTRQFTRINALLEDAKAKGARVISCIPEPQNNHGRKLPLQLILNCTPEMQVLQEELFGPLLPVVPYDSLEEVIQYVNSGERPLAMYCFTHDAANRKELLRRTHAGGVTVNDWGWHVINHDAPFGGIGNSGMGNYHGIEGFRELSHAKTVFKRHRFFPISLFYPPYGNLVQQLVQRLFLGKSDPSVR